MQFWIYQDKARRLSVRLILTYCLAVAVFVVLAAVAIEMVWREVDIQNAGWRAAQALREMPFINTRFFVILFCLLMAIFMAVLAAPISINTEGKSVAEKLGGRLVRPQTRVLAERRLINVVEEMALASSMPVPLVYVIDDPGINAFAAGADQNTAVIGVTKGALDYLNREELQAVIAHEFSHIVNNDVRLSMRMAQLLFGLMFMIELGRAIINLFTGNGSGGGSGGRGRSGGRGGGGGGGSSRSSSSGGAGGIIIIILAIIIICLIFGFVSKFFGLIVQSAVSRQREHLADASSVQFTRTTALASALKKVGALGRTGTLQKTSSIYSQFFFVSIKRDLFSAHPPLDERIRRLEPDWDGNFGSVAPLPFTEAEAPREALAIRLSGWSQGSVAPLAAAAAQEKDEKLIKRSLSMVHAACREPLSACYLVLAMFLPANNTDRNKLLRSEFTITRKETRKYRAALDRIPDHEDLALLEMCAPSLKHLTRDQYDDFDKSMRKFIEHDEIVSFREWVLYQTVQSLAFKHFCPHKNHFPFSSAQTDKAITDLFSALIAASANPDAEIAAFQAKKELYGWGELKIQSFPTPKDLGRSMAVLQEAPLKVRARFLALLHELIAYDGVEHEYEKLFSRMMALCLALPAGEVLRENVG